MIFLPFFGCALVLFLIVLIFFTPFWPILLALIFLYWIFGPRPVVIRQKFQPRQPQNDPPPPRRNGDDDVIDVTAVDVTAPGKDQPSLEENNHAN